MKEDVRIDYNNRKERGLFAAKDFKQNEIVFDLDGDMTEYPTKYSIEIGNGMHVTDRLGTFLNHSCKPNTEIDREKRVVRATHNITKEEELSFDYNLNEYQMASPFNCACGSENCQGIIKGRKVANI